MKKKDEEVKMEQGFPAWGIAGAVLAISAWVTGLIWEGPFVLGKFIGTWLAAALFGLMILAAGYVPFSMAKAQDDWFNKLLYILGGIVLHGTLIYWLFFR